jgi:hypothetical protein
MIISAPDTAPLNNPEEKLRSLDLLRQGPFSGKATIGQRFQT